MHRQGRLRDAWQRYSAILAEHPEHPVALHYAGVVRYQSGDAPGAVELIRRAIHADPAPAEPWSNLAQALGAIGRPEAAVNALKEAARRAPGDPAIWSNLAAAELALKRYDEAERSARRALAIDPRHAGGWHNLALVLEPQGRALEALDAASRAAAIDPADIAGAGLMAQLQDGLGRHEAARRTLEGALARHPASVPLQLQLAAVAQRMGDLPAAAAALERILRLDPGNGAALSELIFLRKRLCDWHDLAALRQRFRAGVAAQRSGLTPFSLLSDPSTRAEQRLCARTWSAQFAASPQPRRRRTLAEGRLRIGYVSADFFDHPTAVLTAGLFEAHDRARFDVVGYSTGPDDGSALRRRVAAAFDRFVDVHDGPPERLAAQIEADRIDILVDLKGHTAGAPSAALALRPAPIQVHYLGYPGTLGAPFMDYLIGDPVVTPLAHAGEYEETLVQLDGCYQANDRSRQPATPAEREALGLPATATVLCCFNNNFKLNPEVIDSWCAILSRAPDSVLWLLAHDDRDPAIAHLRREVEMREVDPLRVVFAPRRPQPEYLAYYHHADLFLDTWPYNAHTTASDALWCGCPVLTWPGATFAGRVGASLLAAIGLPDLVARDAEDYVERAVALARDRAALARYRTHLLGPGRASRLFDVAATARALEWAFETMAAQYRRGERQPICVPQDLRRNATA